MRKTMLVPDGYNGHTVEVYIDRFLDEDIHSVKCQVAEQGKEYMIRWVRKSELPEEINR